LDQDNDGIPDQIERANYMRFDPRRKLSWYRDDKDLNCIYDEEWLALEIQDSYKSGTYDRHDWAKPGKNWPARRSGSRKKPGCGSPSPRRRR
jgi:hypothetical protein